MSAVARLYAAAELETAEAGAAGEVLVGACVFGGARREWAEVLVSDLGAAIAARPPQTDADRARHDAEEIDPLRAAITSGVDPALIAAYERAVTREQEAIEAFDAALRASVVVADDRRQGD